MMASHETAHDVAEYEPGGHAIGSDILAAGSGPDTAAADADPRLVASEPVTLAESLMNEEGWSPLNFSEAGPNPPYLRIGGKLRMTLTEYEPCFSSHIRDRILFRSKVSIAEHLRKYDQMMIDPLAFEECFGPGQGTDATFPFGAWLTIRKIGFSGIELWDKGRGDVEMPLEALSVASAIWLRHADTPRWMLA
ncbi:hypothetical protein [Methylobacterium sp. 10]|uniref:hypothetical protein n=1 Tax=Methylobacterium sp. 10 TaxID=1101191 RepID=UPI0004877F19